MQKGQLRTNTGKKPAIEYNSIYSTDLHVTKVRLLKQQWRVIPQRTKMPVRKPFFPALGHFSPVLKLGVT